MQDEESGTLWSQLSGEALDGPKKGARLATLPMVQTTWEQWYEAHPETELLEKASGMRRSRYEKYFSDPEKTGIFRSRYNEERLPAKSRVFGLADAEHALAVAESAVSEDEPLNLMLAGKPVVLQRAADGGVRAFSAAVDGVPLRFEYNRNGRSIRDDRTDSGWDLSSGVCVTGKYRGRRLEELQVLRAFWFAWSSFYPNTEVID